MGYMAHHAVLVTTYRIDRAEQAHMQAQKCCGTLVSEMRDSAINGYYSFAIFPDGSNEGWEESDRGEANRQAFIEWLEAQRFEDNSSPYAWVEVQYGDGNRETKITRDSDAVWRDGE